MSLQWEVTVCIYMCYMLLVHVVSRAVQYYTACDSPAVACGGGSTVSLHYGHVAGHQLWGGRVQAKCTSFPQNMACSASFLLSSEFGVCSNWYCGHHRLTHACNMLTHTCTCSAKNRGLHVHTCTHARTHIHTLYMYMYRQGQVFLKHLLLIIACKLLYGWNHCKLGKA